jgi:hypothetical protein
MINYINFFFFFKRENETLTFPFFTNSTNFFPVFDLVVARGQCEAMRRGLAMVLPVAVLSLFSWHELDLQVS